MKLNLCASLFYKKEPLDPYNAAIDNVEQLFCFEINPKEAQSIEPDAAAYLGSLIAAGALPQAGSRQAGRTAERRAISWNCRLGSTFLPSCRNFWAGKAVYKWQWRFKKTAFGSGSFWRTACTSDGCLRTAEGLHRCLGV